MICVTVGEPNDTHFKNLRKRLTAGERESPEVRRINALQCSPARNEWLSADAPGPLSRHLALALSGELISLVEHQLPKRQRNLEGSAFPRRAFFFFSEYSEKSEYSDYSGDLYGHLVR